MAIVKENSIKMNKTFNSLMFFMTVLCWTVANAQTPAKPIATPTPSEPIKVWGDLSGTDTIIRLASLGDFEALGEIKEKASKGRRKSGQLSVMTDDEFDTAFALNKLAGTTKPYLHTYHAIGYVATVPGATGNLNIVSAGTIAPDISLRGKNIRITLTKLRVFDYPGGGRHNVLFDFSAQHQASLTTPPETLHFNQTYKVNENDEAGVINRPIFSGLRVGNDGVFFSAFTVNVSNDDDERMLGFLDGDVFKKGLELANSINPLVPIVSGFAQGIGKAMLSKNKDVAVQKFELGLDFDLNSPVGAKLRQGSYIAVQAPQSWNWTEWQYDVSRGMFVSKQNPTQPVPFNYVVFNVSKTTNP